MPQTPDRFPGERYEEGIILQDNTAGDPTENGGVRYTSGDFRMKDSVGVFNPREGGLPAASQVGDMLLSTDGSEFTVQHPIVSCDGWLANWHGELLIEGLEP
jgi:hypothetical protein